ncbi:DUF4192 domain-containing protein [Streptomyces sp. NPDC090106]|uniref:DUF4192 domain-containing protein n=1 Tax=Streptomyces sp. NPDC090106 TaxID=3365946 RepID=UPI00382B52A6
MTNHGENAGIPGNDDIDGCDERPFGDTPHDEPYDEFDDEPCDDPAEFPDSLEPRPTGLAALAGRTDPLECTSYDGHGTQRLTLRSPAELADALPYLLGYRPEDSIVLVALRDKEGRGTFGGRARLGIPANAEDWPAVAKQLAQGLVAGSERRNARPDQMVAYLCQEPGTGESGRQVMERLRALAQFLRVECGRLEVPVIEALCISDGRFWSYCCASEYCCPLEGHAMGLPGTSVLAAAATYAGLQVRGTLKELRARLLPWENASALAQEVALDAAGMAIVPRILDASYRTGVAEETLELAEMLMLRFAHAPRVSGILTADLQDDQLLSHDEAATLILGLQDRTTRDRAAQWMEGDEAPHALRLWRALARRCVGPYGEHAAAPLTLAGWVAWSTGDELEAREALAMALGADPEYLFARLLHQACNEGLDPESIRRCLRAERGVGEQAGHVGPAGPDLRAAADADGCGDVDTRAGADARSSTDTRSSAEGTHDFSGLEESASSTAARTRSTGHRRRSRAASKAAHPAGKGRAASGVRPGIPAQGGSRPGGAPVTGGARTGSPRAGRPYRTGVHGDEAREGNARPGEQGKG